MKNDDFDMIDLDDTANWSKLEIKNKLEQKESEALLEERFMMETGKIEEEYVPKKKTSSNKKPVKKTTKKVAAKPVKKTTKKVAAKPVHKKKKKRNVQEEETIFDKIAYSLSHMDAMDKLVAASGVIVLIVAIVTVSVFSSAKAQGLPGQAPPPLRQ